MEDTDLIINNFFTNLSARHEKPLLEDLTAQEQRQFAEKEKELSNEEEKRRLDAAVSAQVGKS